MLLKNYLAYKAFVQMVHVSETMSSDNLQLYLNI